MSEARPPPERRTPTGFGEQRTRQSACAIIFLLILERVELASITPSQIAPSHHRAAGTQALQITMCSIVPVPPQLVYGEPSTRRFRIGNQPQAAMQIVFRVSR